MANAFTANLNLTKPEVGADTNAWGGHLNADMDILDGIFAPGGGGTGVGLNIPAATTTTTYALNMNGVMTGTGSVNFLGMTTVAVSDATFGISNATDATRIVRISAAAVNTGSTRTISMIDADVTIVGATNTQTLTNKTLSSPAINTATLSVATTGIQFLGATTGTMSLLAAATATGTLLMPSGLTTDTLAVLTAAQTFTHKSMDGSVNTFTNIPLTTAVTGVLPAANGGFPGVTTTNSIASDIGMTNGTLFFDGPTVAQGTTGTWWVSGTVTVTEGGVAAGQVNAKLWDGTTIIAGTVGAVQGASSDVISMSLSGVITNPAGNLRISCQSLSSTIGLIKASGTGITKVSTITAVRIA